MKYGILIWPHANIRYQEASQALSLSELSLLMSESALDSPPKFELIAGAPFLLFETALDVEAVKARLRDHAHLYMLCQINEDGSMVPLSGQREACLGADLPGILKYKGKTNEVFTRFLINMAVYSSAFAGNTGERLKLFDPMCGRGTALFEALNRGWDAYGADIDKADIHEAGAFFKRYLTYHKFKHTTKDMSMTVSGRKPILRKQFAFAPSPEAFKAGDTSELSLMRADALDAARAFPMKSFHVIAMDLPYGVQHAAGSGAKPEALPKLLKRILPTLKGSLRLGGAIALSFNANTLPLQDVRLILTEAGFEVKVGPLYDGLSHWVEQAVTRDVAIATRNITPLA